MRRADEGVEVEHRVALRSDRARVEERLASVVAARRVGGIPEKLTFVKTGEPAGEPDEAYFALRLKSGIVVSIGPAM